MTVALKPPTPTYNLGPVKQWVNNAAYILGPLFNIVNIGGWRESDPFPDHPSGHALDFMITQPGSTAGQKQGDALASYAVQHYQELGIKYIIWNRRYWDPQQGWGPYTGTSNPHTDHVHITFNDSPGVWTGANASSFLTAAYSAGMGNVPNALLLANNSDQLCAWKLNFPVFGESCIASKVFVRQAMGWILIFTGGAGMLIGIAIIAVFTFKQTAMQALIPGPAKKAAPSVPDVEV